MAKEEIRKRGTVTDYRPDDNEVLGGKEKSVQSEATGAEGSENLANDSATNGGAAGRINDPAKRPEIARYEGGENEENGGRAR